MILSHRDIEEIAAAITRDFNYSFFGAEAEIQQRRPLPTPIDQMASEYLKLEVTFAKLSADGSIMGLTAYTDTAYEIEEDGERYILPLRRNQIVLDSSFIQPGNVRRLCGKRRFTLAHECAHQILFQLEEDESKADHAGKYSERKVHTPRTLKTHEDWNEWRANALGAALLMPQAEVDRAMWYLNRGRPLVSYGDCFFDGARDCMDAFCSTFGVSKSAASIRLEQLGYLQKRDVAEYQHPLDVMV